MTQLKDIISVGHRCRCIHFGKNFNTSLFNFNQLTAVKGFQKLVLASNQHVSTTLAEIGAFWVEQLAVEANVWLAEQI